MNDSSSVRSRIALPSKKCGALAIELSIFSLTISRTSNEGRSVRRPTRRAFFPYFPANRLKLDATCRNFSLNSNAKFFQTICMSIIRVFSPLYLAQIIL